MPPKKDPKPASASLDALEHQTLDEAQYKKGLKIQQLRLLQLQRELPVQKKNVIVVMEGPDAAGKGGAIKRLVERLDPRSLRVYSIIKPTLEEYQHHYMWRFWTKIPAEGQITVFDRSWYGRVLVERVEGFATEVDWQRAFQEINEFERTLHDGGAIIVKIYLHITKEEQLARFERRSSDPLKHWKITDEDWRNRKKWEQHVEAAEEMFARTSPAFAPWQLVAGNFKWHARLAVATLMADAIENGLK